MNVIPMNPNLIIITEDNKKEIRRIHEIDDEEKLQDGVTALVEWCSKQHHFVTKNLTKLFLEKGLILTENSVEDAKMKIDRLITTRGLMEDLMLKRTPEEMKRVCQVLRYLPFPKLNPMDQTRVVILQFLPNNSDDFNVRQFCRFAIMITEYCHAFDYSVGTRCVYDLKNLNINILAKLNPIILRKVLVFATNVYGLKMKGFHLLNAPSFVDKVMFLFKTVLSRKLMERVHIHSTYEDFHKHVSREVLPSDYGGEERSMAELHAQWMEELSSPAVADYCIACDRLVTDESKRINANPYNEEYFGMFGNFRQITVD